MLLEPFVTLTRPTDVTTEFQWGQAGAMFGKVDERAVIRVSTMD